MPKLDHLTPEQKADRARELARERGRRYRARNPERVRELVAERRRKWTKDNPMGWRSAQWKYYYGIVADDYKRMFDEQKGACAICGAAPDEGKLLHVDHCHASGKIRGLLCKHCNHGLGNFKDDMSRLREAMKYLQERGN